jgi:hypothetical protein
LLPTAWCPIIFTEISAGRHFSSLRKIRASGDCIEKFDEGGTEVDVVGFVTGTTNTGRTKTGGWDSSARVVSFTLAEVAR